MNFLATLEEQKIKEHNASSSLDQPQRLDYRILFGIETVATHSEVNELPVRTAQLFRYRLKETDYILQTGDPDDDVI
jgi:hypothetical protein